VRRTLGIAFKLIALATMLFLLYPLAGQIVGPLPPGAPAEPVLHGCVAGAARRGSAGAVNPRAVIDAARAQAPRNRTAKSNSSVLHTCGNRGQ
jgi:hypothetical protein